MREIKVRYVLAANLDTDEPINEGIKTLELFDCTIERIEEGEPIEAAINTGQEIIDRLLFTGLHDKNGKEIYEGDILRDDGGYLTEVAWDEGDACFVDIGLMGREVCPPCVFSTVEVIGNIYKNPELLKEEDQE